MTFEERREYQRNWEHSNKDRRREINRRRRLKLVENFSEYKSKLSCVICGENEACCLDFHHKDPNNKEFNISEAGRGGISEKRLLEEIAKCDVLCANCHRKFHSGVVPIGRTPPL